MRVRDQRTMFFGCSISDGQSESNSHHRQCCRRSNHAQLERTGCSGHRDPYRKSERNSLNSARQSRLDPNGCVGIRWAYVLSSGCHGRKPVDFGLHARYARRSSTEARSSLALESAVGVGGWGVNHSIAGTRSVRILLAAAGIVGDSPWFWSSVRAKLRVAWATPVVNKSSCPVLLISDLSAL